LMVPQVTTAVSRGSFSPIYVAVNQFKVIGQFSQKQIVPYFWIQWSEAPSRQPQPPQ
jgi:hypothetical protein